jgi:polyhydroxybutyrate depolymerase
MAQWQCLSSGGLKRAVHNTLLKRLEYPITRTGWLIASLLFSLSPAVADCVLPTACVLPSGRYQVRLPVGADTTKGPVIVFYHGWRETPEMLLADPVPARFADAQRAILVAPEGLGQTWSYPGSPGQLRDERPFAEELFAAIRKRFPDRRIIAAGFSQGASMVWWLACRQPHLADAFVSISGGFWEPSPASCSGSGATLVHIHGRGDVTVPLAGRQIRGGAYRQSDVRRDWAIWLGENSCAAAPSSMLNSGDRACELWTQCAKGKALAFCLHDQGHQIHADDLHAMQAALQRLKVWP